MGQEEEIIIGDDDEEDDGAQDPGIIARMMGMFGLDGTAVDN